MTNYIARNRKLLLHIAFWLVYASFFFYQISYGRRGDLNWERIIPDFSFHIASLLALSYLNYFVFLPKLLKDKKLGNYLLKFLPIVAVASYLILMGKRAILLATLEDAEWVYRDKFAVNVVLGGFFIVVFVSLLRFVEDYIDNESKRNELQNQQLTSELQFLRAQVNPHFLFNTLNNLYYLAVSESPQTPEVIAKLAGLMRYLLHDSNSEKVSLEKEIEYMQNYIDLEQLRLEGEVAISFQIEGETAGVQIAPLILITFLENAFKHGVSNSMKDSFIRARLKIEASQCSFIVTNSKVRDQSKTVTESSGIGLANARRRLELSYPKKHTLTVKDQQQEYEVQLNINLSK